MSPDGRDNPTLPGLLGAVAVILALIVGLCLVWIADPLGVADDIARWFR